VPYRSVAEAPCVQGTSAKEQDEDNDQEDEAHFIDLQLRRLAG